MWGVRPIEDIFATVILWDVYDCLVMSVYLECAVIIKGFAVKGV